MNWAQILDKTKDIEAFSESNQKNEDEKEETYTLEVFSFLASKEVPSECR